MANMAFTSKKHFCEGMFHVYPWQECGVKGHLCLREKEIEFCDHRQLVLVIVLNELIAIYYRKNTTHAEQVMCEDAYLKQFISTTQKPATLHMFIKFQPCSHSSGNSRHFVDGYGYDERSCSEALLSFFQTYLEPNNISIEIAIAGLYKAHWEFSKRPDDIISVKNARHGLELLLTNDINIRGMTPADWKFLSSLSSELIGEDVINHPRRIQADKLTAAFLLTFKEKILQKKKEEHRKKRHKTNS